MLFIIVAAATTGVIGPDLLGAQQPRAGGGPSLAQETGQFSSGGTIVWLRVTDEGTVLVFAAKGFRSAFAHPTVLTPEETDHWADALTAFIAADSAAGGRGGVDSATVRVALAGGDVTLEEQTLGQALALVARFGATGPAPVSAVYHAIGLRPIIPTLRQTAQIARKIQAIHRAAAAAVVAPASPIPTTEAATPAGLPAATTRAVEHSGGSPAAAGETGALAKPSPTVQNSTTAARQSTAVAPPISRQVVPAAPAATGSSSAQPTLVVPVALSADSVAKVRTHAPPLTMKVPTTAHSLTAPSDSARAEIGHVANAPDSHIEYAGGQPLSLRIGAGSDAQGAGAKVDSAARATPPAKGAGDGKPSKGAPAAGTTGGKKSADVDSDSPGDSVAERALSTEGRLPPSVLGDVVRQRQQLLQFCYTEFGLRKDPSLAGQIQVRLVIQQEGTVSEVTVPQHHWSGHGADQVESCIRERVLHWQFPAAQRASTHEIQLIFGR